MEEVTTEEKQVQQKIERKTQVKIDYDKPQLMYIKANEHRVNLIDNRFNFLGLSRGKNFNYLNLERAELMPNTDDKFQITIELSRNVFIQKRIVYDIFMMLGDVGGLFEIFLYTFSVVCGFVSVSSFRMESIRTFFLVSTQECDSPTERLSEMKPASVSCCSALLYALPTKKCLKGNKKLQTLKKGRKRLRKSLDVVTIVQQNRTLNTLLKLLLNSSEQRLIKF